MFGLIIEFGLYKRHVSTSTARTAALFGYQESVSCVHSVPNLRNSIYCATALGSHEDVPTIESGRLDDSI